MDKTLLVNAGVFAAGLIVGSLVTLGITKYANTITKEEPDAVTTAQATAEEPAAAAV
jgi:hypothetical protein